MSVYGANLDGVSIRPHHDVALIRPRADLHAALHGAQVEGGRIMTNMFGAVRVDSPINYLVTGKLNQFAIGQVVRMGEGAVTGQGVDRPSVGAGDIVGFDLGQVGHHLPDGNYSLPWRSLLCHFDEHARGGEPVPLMNHVMVEHHEELVDRFVFSRSSRRLHLAKCKGAAVKTGDNRMTRVGLDVGRVVGAGAGRFVRGTFEACGCKPGDVVAFSPTSGVVDFMFSRGRLLRFVPWRECEFTVGP